MMVEGAVSASAFLRTHLARQAEPVARHDWCGVPVWVKRAGPRHGMGRYRVLGALAWTLRLPVLRPVLNLGGPQAIATEVRRLRELAARGLRVPEVLAEQPEGFMMRHLGAPGESTPSLTDEIDVALRAGEAALVLRHWRDGLRALAHAHAAGACLSQAFARNLVRCPDGVVGYIDFEDDPATVLPLAVCQARDALCYAHSTALALREAGVLDAARADWAAWRAERPAAVQAALRDAADRLRWMRRLPEDRRLGRDLQRARAAYDLLQV